MRYVTMAGAALAVLALAGCNRDGGGNNQAATNAQTGLPTPPTRTGASGPANNPAGLKVDAVQAANACISAEDQRRPLAEISREQRLQVVACLNAAAVRQIEGQLPRTIDSATRLDRITADGVLLTYHATITLPPSQLPPNAAEQLSTMARQNVCAQPQMRQTLMMGGAYAYRWTDTNGSLVQEVRIDGC